jgi:murein DD-endopeptidase MepM/ murein hydrolase activator NlpD
MSSFTPPIKGFNMAYHPKGTMTQAFGENPAIYRRWGLKAHNGQDHVAPHGTPMMAVEDAVVVDVKLNPDGYGKYVRIMSKGHVSGKYRIWVYGHCSKIHVVVGEEVKQGDVIALMGNTGFVISGANPFWKTNPYAGTHLHLGVRIAQKNMGGWRYHSGMDKIEIQDYDNGYKGCIDPALYFTSDEDFDPKPQMLTIISMLNTVVGLLQILKSQKK